MDLEKLWQSTLADIELKISKANFLTWLKNSQLLEKTKDGKVVIGLVNNFAKEWVQSKYHKMILEILQAQDADIKKIEYTVLKQTKTASFFKKPQKPIEKQLSFEQFKVNPETGLHPKYKLETFVVGSSNELAYAASLAIIKNIGIKYNPFFVYGRTGLGKTHLIQAVGNEIVKLYKNKVKVKYVHSETFVNDVVSSIRNKRIEDVKRKYRNVDVLIIDDIQFIGGKERSEEEFFHTFNALYENSKQIIISSDRSPSAIPTLGERLRSRFEGGMIADITYPDYEMRLAIIKTKLQELNKELPDEICYLIAEKVKRNIREIEGILNKLVFYKEIKNEELTEKKVEEIINQTIQFPTQNLTASKIIKTVANFYEVLPNDIINHSRKKQLIEPRQVAVFLLREILSMSYPDIGEKLGKRDHTTIIHAYEKINKEINKNPNLNQKILMIKDLILNDTN